MTWKYTSMFLLSIVILSCGIQNQEVDESDQISKAQWQDIASWNLDAINSDLEEGKLTTDIGIYFPSNLDPDFDKVTLDKMMESFLAAKEIYEPTGVQLRLKFARTGAIDPSYLAIQANEIPQVPATEYNNTYVNMQRNPARLTEKAKDALTHIIEDDPESDRTIYLIVFQDVFYPFLTVAEGRNWMMNSVRTGGLSFPPYMYGENIPAKHRGVISISNLQRGERSRRTIAHELGHKLMNVSHEYRETHPGHEVYADGGLMLYGDGEEIPSGEEGRWHLERLLISPFLYRIENGVKVWNADYKEGGHYYDPLYGDYVIHFKGTPPIDPNW